MSRSSLAGVDRRSSISHLPRLLLPLALAACAALATGCASSPGSTTASRRTTTTAVPTTFVPPNSTTTSIPLIYEVTTSPITGLGTILVDGEGLTLYMFEPDRQSGRSTCAGECENRWPPVILVDGAKAPLAGSGVSPSLLGTTVRADGFTQITYNGWPLYLWHGDSKPGDTAGQGLNDSGGLWYVLNPEGVPVTLQP